MADQTTDTVQADAAALVAMTVADLVAHIDGVDLPTLTAALSLEQAGAARKGALAALEEAVAGHPESAAAAAEAADDEATPQDPAEPSEQPGEPEPHEQPAIDLADAVIPMTHPDGGTCDRYEHDENGNILVPAIDAADMLGHGFVVA